MVYAAPLLPLLLVLFTLLSEVMLPLLPRALSPGRAVEVGWLALALAVLRAGDGGGDGIPVLTSNPPPGPCDYISMLFCGLSEGEKTYRLPRR